MLCRISYLDGWEDGNSLMASNYSTVPLADFCLKNDEEHVNWEKKANVDASV